MQAMEEKLSDLEGDNSAWDPEEQQPKQEPEVAGPQESAYELAPETVAAATYEAMDET